MTECTSDTADTQSEPARASAGRRAVSHVRAWGSTFRRYAAVAAFVAGVPLLAQAESVLRVVPQANLVVLDPIWTTAFVTRNHGFMIYDTLFGVDAQGKVQPQMVDKWTESQDRLRYSFTLRKGLQFHNGQPVTSKDVIASLKRWSQRDSVGVLLAQRIDRYEAPSDSTFEIHLKQPFGILLDALGKGMGNVAFIMPANIASTPATEQIKENIGSGPYRFVASAYRPGERAVYEKNTAYVPRAEAPSGTTGAKRVFVDKVEWVFLRDPQTQFSALTGGEVDVIEQPSFEQYTSLKQASGVSLVNTLPLGRQYYMRMNFLQPPFNNPLIRRAAMAALGQEEHLRTQVGSPEFYKVCTSIFPCGTTYESKLTGTYTGKTNVARARELLKEANYDGTPVTLLRATDLAFISKLPLVTKQLLEAAGFKVNLQQSDWATVVTRRTNKGPGAEGGWSAFHTAGESDPNPLTKLYLDARGEQGWFGWQADPEIERLKSEFLVEPTEVGRKRIADELQVRVLDTVSLVPMGQFINPAAIRTNVTGILPAQAQIYWNIKVGK